jgi:pyruvate dehydrogenase E2 component (dihydrolipoamide acetyltransferase)
MEKKPGDTVKRGDIIAGVETQKDLSNEIFDEGIIDKFIQTGTKVPVGPSWHYYSRVAFL